MKLPEGTIFKRKDKNGWWWRFMLDGKRHCLSAGRTKQDALEFRRRFWEEQRELDRSGGKPIDPILFKDFVPIYLEHAAKTKAATTAVRERQKLEGLLVPVFGDSNMHEIRPEDVVRWVARRKVKIATRNRDLSQVSALFRYAVQLGHARSDPAKDIKRLREELKPIPYVEERIQNAYLVALPDELRPICEVAVDSGMRQGELLALVWTDVDLSEGTITVRKSKNKLPRLIPMTSRVRAVLEAASALRVTPLKGAERVFRGIKEKWGGYLTNKVKRAARKVGIEDMTFHTMRHWFATNLVRRGVPLGDVAKLTGHKTLTMLMRYGCHSPQDSSWSAIAALDDASTAREVADEYE